MKTFKQYLTEAEIAAQPAPTAAAPADSDPGEDILDVAATPEVKAFIDANTVRDAEGDVDFAASIGQMMTKASADLDVKGLQDALVEMEANFKAFPSTPEFQAMSPEDQAEWKQKAPEGMQAMRDLAAHFAELQKTWASGGQQLTDLSKSSDYQNPMKGVKSLSTPPVQEGDELTAMLRIAGLR